jgi:hypothetical protein
MAGADNDYVEMFSELHGVKVSSSKWRKGTQTRCSQLKRQI